MADKKGKVVAALSAVAAYLASEKVPLAVPSYDVIPSPWATSGRQDVMRMRTLWQRRIVPQLQRLFRE